MYTFFFFSLKLELEKIVQEKTDLQRHYVMVSQRSRERPLDIFTEFTNTLLKPYFYFPSFRRHPSSWYFKWKPKIIFILRPNKVSINAKFFRSTLIENFKKEL